MAKKKAATVVGTFEVVKPYLERAMTDEDFRKDLKDALATDKKAQDQMRRAIDDLLSAKDNLKGKGKKSHKGRNMVLLAGLVAGALYNPWTGPQTREKLLDVIAGQDDLQPLDTFETTVADASAAVEETAGDAADAAENAAKSTRSKATS